ncbi:hypothetical protein T484DRAFT_1610085, partial [Baffinella frigidus]
MCAAPCGGGFYGSGTECAGCPPGSNSAPGSETVMGCACPGSTLSAADCLCKSGFYSSGSGADLTCAACPAGSVSPGGSINAESCQCPAGTFGKPPLSNCTQRFCVCGCPFDHYGSGASCTPCPAGSTAPAGS